MKTLENILKNIENIQKEIPSIHSTNDNLTGFWQWKIDLQKKSYNLGQSKYGFLFFWFLFFLAIFFPLMRELTKNSPVLGQIFAPLAAFLWFYCLIYLPYKVFTYKPDTDLKKIQKLQDFITQIHNTPTVLHYANKDLKTLLESEKTSNITIVSEKILKTIENISKNQNKIQKYFKTDYIQKVEKIILKEIQLLQNILEYSFENQVKNHEKLISEIKNLQNSEWKNFSEILELQKIRLENQKHIFEKILEK